MSATPPEANTEYSRGLRVSRKAGFGLARPISSIGAVFAAAGLLGSLLLIVAEFTALYSVNIAGRNVVAVGTETAGAHNAYAMIPIALLAATLAVTALRSRSRPALLAIAVLGVVAILIAVVGDLPDTHAHGLTQHDQLASNSAGPGLYLETLGGVLLLLAGGLGLAAFGSEGRTGDAGTAQGDGGGAALRGGRRGGAAVDRPGGGGPRSGRSAYPF